MATKTLKEACKLYIAHQKAEGKAPLTQATMQRCMAILTELGEGKEVSKIRTEQIEKLFAGERVNMHQGKKGLKPRAPSSVLQIKRNIRSALIWFHGQGWIDRFAVPEEEKRFVERSKKADEQPKPKAKKAKKAKAQEDSGENDSSVQTAATEASEPQQQAIGDPPPPVDNVLVLGEPSASEPALTLGDVPKSGDLAPSTL